MISTTKIVILSLFISAVRSTSIFCNETPESHLFCIPRGYVKAEAPSIYNSSDKIVLMNPFLKEIPQINMKENYITFKFYLNIKWTDSRLIFSKETNSRGWIPLDLDRIKSIWLPDVYIYSQEKITEYSLLTEAA